jgi:hypothetical protein
MAKKPTPEEKLLADASKLIMHTLHVVSVRLADRYEKKLMTDLIAQMQARLDANEEVNHFTGNYINDKLNDLSK